METYRVEVVSPLDIRESTPNAPNKIEVAVRTSAFLIMPRLIQNYKRKNGKGKKNTFPLHISIKQ